jgi:hypothetical protein
MSWTKKIQMPYANENGLRSRQLRAPYTMSVAAIIDSCRTSVVNKSELMCYSCPIKLFLFPSRIT